MTTKKILTSLFMVLALLVAAYIGKEIYQWYDRISCPTAVRTEPLSMPEYNNAQQVHTKETTQGDFYTRQVEFVTTDSTEDVISFYKTQLREAGWKLGDNDGSTVFGFGEDSALPEYYLTLYVNRIGSSTNVKIVIQHQPCLPPV